MLRNCFGSTLRIPCLKAEGTTMVGPLAAPSPPDVGVLSPSENKLLLVPRLKPALRRATDACGGNSTYCPGPVTRVERQKDFPYRNLCGGFKGHERRIMPKRLSRIKIAENETQCPHINRASAKVDGLQQPRFKPCLGWS